MAAKRTIPNEAPWRLTFLVDWNTAKKYKAAAKAENMKIPQYLAMLVHCGYSARQTKAEGKR